MIALMVRYGSEADIDRVTADVSFGPTADMRDRFSHLRTTSAASQKRTLVELLTISVSEHLATSVPGVHPDEFAIDLTVDFDPFRSPHGLRLHGRMTS